MNKKGTEKKKIQGLRKQLMQLSMLPLFFLGIIMLFVSYISFYNVISNQVKKELSDVARATLYAYNSLYEDDHTFIKDDDGKYWLADEDGSAKDYEEFIEYMKADTGIDITIFFYDIRVATTIHDTSGNKITGTAASKNIVDDVMGAETASFFDNVEIFDVNYYAYYQPVLNNSGECKGMIFAGRPNREVKSSIIKGTWPIILVTVLMMLLVSSITVSIVKGYADVIRKERNFLGEIARGNFKATLDADIIKRKDELGEMGLSTVRLQKFLRNMVERDALTKLLTRRIGEIGFANTRAEYIESNIPYCVVMGDIDHFKRFNDTYGHDCGDLVLQSVAATFNRLVFGHGYAIRWGGEEFIIVFDDCTLEKGIELLNKIRDAVLESEVVYNDEVLKITMTYGIVAGDDRPMEEIIKEVDNLLYVGKEGGRNRIVVAEVGENA